MKCKCGYEGWAEVGDFGFNKKLLFPSHFKCPKCKSTEDIVYIENFDSVRKSLLYPRKCFGGYDGQSKHQEGKQIIIFLKGGVNKTLVGYSIHCPICQWGHGSALELEDYNKIKEWADNNQIDTNVMPV